MKSPGESFAMGVQSRKQSKLSWTSLSGWEHSFVQTSTSRSQHWILDSPHGTWYHNENKKDIWGGSKLCI